MSIPICRVLETGVALSLQDTGRMRWRRFGVPPGGVMDSYSAQQANRLVGNPPQAPVLEILHSGARLEFLAPCRAAVAGADMDATIPAWTAREVKGGEVITFPRNRGGLWAYLAIPGGFASPEWFGSVSTDPRNGVGEPLCKSSILRAPGPSAHTGDSPLGVRKLRQDLRRDFNHPPRMTLHPGPQWEKFQSASLELLASPEWTISPRSDRTGFRLEGPPLPAPPAGKSQPVIPGCIQIPASGQPIVILNDGPTVGGYPVAAVLDERDLNWFVQCRPGMPVSFQWNAS